MAKLPELAAALDCTVTYLVGLTDDAHSWVPDESVVIPARGGPLAVAMWSNGRPPDAASLILGEDIPARRIGPRLGPQPDVIDPSRKTLSASCACSADMCSSANPLWIRM